jgi:hypothetical protein
MVHHAVRRALLAVQSGQVTRIYRGNGNMLIAPDGIGVATLRRLEREGLIRDGKDISRGLTPECHIVLTKAGKAILESADV